MVLVGRPMVLVGRPMVLVGRPFLLAGHFAIQPREMISAVESRG